MPAYRTERRMRVESLQELPPVLDHDLVVVTVSAHVYKFSSSRLWATLPWDKGKVTLSKCLCRFVTSPRIPTTVDEHVGIVYHLRTGYADTALRKHTRNRLLGESFVKMACPKATFAKNTLVTDAPFLRRMVGGRQKASAVSAQTGFKMDADLYADILLCSKASIIYTQRQSSFLRPLLARSFCKTIVRDVDKSAWCPHFSTVFPRDVFLATSRPSRFAAMRSSMPSWHPCKNVSGPACAMLLDAALS